MHVCMNVYMGVGRQVGRYNIYYIYVCVRVCVYIYIYIYADADR